MAQIGKKYVRIVSITLYLQTVGHVTRKTKSVKHVILTSGFHNRPFSSQPLRVPHTRAGHYVTQSNEENLRYESINRRGGGPQRERGSTTKRESVGNCAQLTCTPGSSRKWGRQARPSNKPYVRNHCT